MRIYKSVIRPSIKRIKTLKIKVLRKITQNKNKTSGRNGNKDKCPDLMIQNYERQVEEQGGLNSLIERKEVKYSE